MHSPTIIKFNPKGNDDGWLVPIESQKTIPFKIERVYYIYKTKMGVVRGKHAHKNLKQVLICLNGEIDIYCEWTGKKQTFHLNSPTEGLLIDGLVWHEMKNFSENAVLLVLADKHYADDDYIRDYETYFKLSSQRMYENCHSR